VCLNSGTLFAHSSNTGQAVLTLSPSGSYTISEPGNSRLVSLVKPDQGVICVVNDGGFPITQDFGETTYVFNIGATLTTEPPSTVARSYHQGVYAGTFEVTAAY
jgi:hypothetical protein